jgi:uncharacterized C2H2 Zn-finger protein
MTMRTRDGDRFTVAGVCRQIVRRRNSSARGIGKAMGHRNAR